MDYSNRELDTKFQQIMDGIARIEEQTTKTNGRVTKLEFWKESIMAKIAGVVGSITVGWVVIKEFLIK